MKRCILLLAPLVLLWGCSRTEYSPVISPEFAQNAVYSSGDFSFSCDIERSDDYITVTVTSTNAKDMIMTCDGTTVTMDYKGLKHQMSKSKVNANNPALVLYQVFDCVCSLEQNDVIKVPEGYQYSGKTSVGDFTLIQNVDNSFSTLVVPDADISVKFDNA